jgi:NAD(P)-dependent dehydrogenase (short-subunit alcohol dehydrogenase family)
MLAIGEALARRLTAEGADVVGHYPSHPAGAKRVPAVADGRLLWNYQEQ